MTLALVLVCLPTLALAQADGGAPPDDVSMEALLQEEKALLDGLASGEVGGFGYRLEALDTTLRLHAYATLDYTYFSATDQHSFDAHYFNLFVSANIADRVFPELQLELEHVTEVGVRFAQVDVKAFDFLVVRAGLFLLPFGSFNEFLYPEYLSKVPRSPLVLTHAQIVPVAWNDVGLQLRGKVALGHHAFNYALYVVNGLLQQDASPGDGVVDEGGPIRAMRGNFLGLANPRKAFGGRVGVTLFDEAVNVGLSGYRGNYTVDATRALSMYGADVTVKLKALWVMLEAVRSHQELSGNQELVKQGVYAVASYKLGTFFEPALAFDRAVVGGPAAQNKSRTTFCLNFYPFERIRLLVRAAYTLSLADNGARDDLFMLQSSIGF